MPRFRTLVLKAVFFIHFHSEFDMVAFVFDVICVICYLIWSSLFCYHGNLAADRVSSVGSSAYNSNWFHLPVEMQKFMTLIIARSQNPVYFTGLGLIDCTMEVFEKV